MENKTEELSSQEQAKIVALAKKAFQEKLQEGRKVLAKIDASLANEKVNQKGLDSSVDV